MGRPRIVPTETHPCSVCGEPVPIKPTDSPASYKKRLTCGRACTMAANANSRRGKPAWNNNSVTLICAICERPFTVPPSTAKRGAKYCSRACFEVSHRETMHRINEEKFAADRVPCPCPICGKVVMRSRSMAKQLVHCSKECDNEARRRVTGEDHPLHKPKVQMRCEVCGKVCQVKPSLVSRFRSCSKRCNAALAQMAFPRTSSIEKAVAETLDALGEPYVAQKPFQWYVVDFWLPRFNAVIECDGDYWHSLPRVQRIDKAKNSYFRNRGIPLVRLTETEIKADVVAAVQRAIHHVTPRQASLQEKLLTFR